MSHQSVVCRILSEWLETKFGGGQEPSDGTLRTIHFTNTIQEKEQSLHRVHISIKVRSHVQSWPVKEEKYLQTLHDRWYMVDRGEPKQENLMSDGEDCVCF